MALSNSIKDFDQRRLRPTTVQVRTADGRVSFTDRNGNVFSTIVRPAHVNDDISQFGFIVNNKPDLQIGEVVVQGTTYSFGMPLIFLNAGVSGSQDVAEDFDVLRHKGITHIVNLISNYMSNKFEGSFEYLSCVLYDDMQADLLPTVTACCSFIQEKVLPSHGRLFIHCNAGASRAPSVLIGCLIKIYELPFDTAFRLVNNARNISPNLNFKMQLRALSARTVPMRTVE